MKILFTGQLGDTNHTEIWLFHKFGRKIEPLEDVDFSRN